MTLNAEELAEVRGGTTGIITGILFLLGGLITVLFGVLDGYYNSIKCARRR